MYLDVENRLKSLEEKMSGTILALKAIYEELSSRKYDLETPDVEDSEKTRPRDAWVTVTIKVPNAVSIQDTIDDEDGRDMEQLVKDMILTSGLEEVCDLDDFRIEDIEIED